MILFFGSMFGYMVYLIILKWSMHWDELMAEGHTPPPLINHLIGIVLSPGKVNSPLFPTQASVQKNILILCGLCMPVILLGKQ